MIQFSVFFLVASKSTDTESLKYSLRKNISSDSRIMDVLNLGLAEKECKEEDLRDCLSSLQHSVIDHFHDLGKLNKDKYCQDVNKGKQCMDDAFQNCGDKHTHMSYLISSFYIYLNQICTEKGKMYMDIAPCLQHHASEFDKCKTDDNQHDNPMDDICRETDYLKCVASLAKKVCDKGESFGQAVEEHVANLHSNVCNSAATLAANYWKLLILILGVLFLKRSGAEISFFF